MNFFTVFLLILRLEGDRRVQKRPHKNHRQCDSLSLRASLCILVRTLFDATVTVKPQNQKNHCIILLIKKIFNFVLDTPKMEFESVDSLCSFLILIF
jgi:hypothetical protein